MTDDDLAPEMIRPHEPRRSSLRRMAIGGLALCALAALAVVALRHRHEKGFIVALAAVGDDSAVIVWRANHDETPSTSWVARVDAKGRVLWTQPIPALAMTIGGNGGLTVLDGVAVVRYGHTDERGYTAIDSAAIAFDLGDGHRLWDRVLSPYQPYPIEGYGMSRLAVLPPHVSDLAVGTSLMSFADAGKRIVATSTEVRTGAAGATQPSGEFWSPVVFGDSYAVHDVWAAHLTELPGGAERLVKTRGTGCAIGAEYLVVEARPSGNALVAYASATSEPRVIAEPFDALAGDAHVISCGRTADRLVFLVESSGAETMVTEVVITDAGGKLLHRVPVGTGWAMDEVSRSDPSRATLAGDGLPRFVLVPEDEQSSNGGAHLGRLIMLDLEVGTVAWRSPPDPELRHGTIFRAGNAWIWWGRPQILAMFDGASGKLVAALAAVSDRGLFVSNDPQPLVASASTLWIYGNQWTSPEDAPLAAIDLATMTTRFARSVNLTDATAAMKAKLGL